jgi:hypothetical protein
MSDEIREELFRGGVVDITTNGRRTGEARRIEIRLHNVDNELYLTGQPGPRGWHANLLMTPDFKVHLKRELIADLEAHATEVRDVDEKRRISRVILDRMGRTEQLEERMKGSPLMHIQVVQPKA